MRSISAAAASLLLLCVAQAASAQTNSSALLSQLQLNPLAQRASDAAKSKAGAALAAAESVPQAAAAVGSDVLSSLSLGYPNSRVNSSCIKTSFEYAEAFRKGEIRCVSPCLFGRFVDTSADPIWRAGSPLPPKNASEYMKGPKVTLAFVVPSSGLESFLETSALAAGDTSKLAGAILASLGIGADDLGLSKGDRIPLKVFGDDCSLFERTNARVKVSYPTFPDAFDRVTREFKLSPTVLGEDALRPLQLAYSYGGGSVAAQFRALTGCNVNVNGTDAPDCGSAVNRAGAGGGIPAGSLPACAAYVTALQAFCTPAGTQNYDSASCVSTLTELAAKNAGGQATALQARAMFAACFDFLAGFNTDNAMITDGNGRLAGREYLVTGNGLLKQAGGYFIEWLTVA